MAVNAAASGGLRHRLGQLRPRAKRVRANSGLSADSGAIRYKRSRTLVKLAGPISASPIRASAVLSEGAEPLHGPLRQWRLGVGDQSTYAQRNAIWNASLGIGEVAQKNVVAGKRGPHRLSVD